MEDERRIDELCCENEQLRQENQSIGMAAYELGRASLADENAKLRELVRHLRECTRHNVCAVCKYADDACDFDYDMRELGLEVE